MLKVRGVGRLIILRRVKVTGNIIIHTSKKGLVECEVAFHKEFLKHREDGINN